MKCIICGSSMAYFFSKRFNLYGLGDVDYWRCEACGFTASRTHFEMSDQEWEELNIEFHNDSNQREDNPYNRNQRYFHQAQMLHLMKRHQILNPDSWLDWGCGEGKVSLQLASNFDVTMACFDKYITPLSNAVSENEMVMRGHGLVVNTAVFEHVRDRATLDEIESYVADNGCLAVHTLVRGDIPQDPDWMYLLPVHCAFHTNQSMQVLMDQWGYHCSVYNEHAKMWVMFRNSVKAIKNRVSSLNALMGWDYLHFKDGFMDYWP